MSLPVVPLGLPQDLARLLTEMRNAISTVRPSEFPPAQPLNLTVTPLAAGNQITFTRSEDALGHVVRFGPNSSWNPATDFQADIGDSNIFTDHTGNAGVTRYYWVVARKNDLYSQPVGPVKSTSLAIGTPVAIPQPPPSSGALRVSNETHLPVALRPHGSGRFAS